MLGNILGLELGNVQFRGVVGKVPANSKPPD